jgi:EAL domain-containing protein (putative c-di-GMP-specific phosphodiesterase class I)
LDFLPIAEEAGLMPQVTAWVLDQALAQCARWRSSGRILNVSLNISATNLLDPEFFDVVHSSMVTHQVPPSALILEITETTVIADFQRCKVAIAQLCDLGLAISIDDFGAGFTSLAYLGSLAVSELKLDRTFVSGLTAEENQRDLALLRATIELGHALGLRVVAEGVEHRKTLDSLTDVGCDLAQGYFIAPPMSAGDLALWPGVGFHLEAASGMEAERVERAAVGG